ncbi:MAG: hypothetical protein ABSB34_13135 [Candidatus Limnocylindrales bacterium]
MDFLSGEPGVDPHRIGLWGFSLGGGHVLYVATHDPRPRCLVTQCPSMDGRWVNQFRDPRRMAIQRGSRGDRSGAAECRRPGPRQPERYAAPVPDGGLPPRGLRRSFARPHPHHRGGPRRTRRQPFLREEGLRDRRAHGADTLRGGGGDPRLH